MTRRRLALGRRAAYLFGIVTAIATALGAGVAMGQAPAKNLSYPKHYQSAVADVRNLIWDIDEEAWCEDFPGVKRDFDVAKKRLTRLLEEAFATGQSVAFYVLDATLDDLEDAFDEYKRACSGPRLAGLRRVRISADFGFLSQSSTGHVQRLAHDVGGTISYDFGNVDPTSSGGAFQIGAEIPFQKNGNTSYFLTGSYAFAALSSSANGSANGPFNIPGLGVGNNPNGFATAANTPVSYQYESDSIRHEFDLSAGTRTRSGPVYISPRFGGLVGIYSVDDDYTFNRPSPPNTITGNYTTNSTAYTLGGYVRLDLDYRPPDSNVTLFTSAKAGVDFNWASSDVTLQLTSPLNEFQNVSISDTKVTPNLSLEGGVRLDLGAWDGYVKGKIQYGRYVPNVSIPGGGALPNLYGETATEYSVMAGLRGDLWGDWPKFGPAGKAPVPPLVFSDIRLKRDISQVGRLANGLKLYRFHYVWSDTEYVGVMAQEVRLLMPDAVVNGTDGFLRVDYARLGTRMMTWHEWLAAGICAEASAPRDVCRPDQAG